LQEAAGQDRRRTAYVRALLEVTPPDDTVTWPPLLTVASTEVPPERTTRSVPLWTVMSEEVMHEEMKIVVIDPSPSRSGSSGARAPPVFQGSPHEALRH
jgi:hypothetical protein